MKAALLREVNQPLTIEEVELDEPQAREVVVSTGATGLCHSDLKIMTGEDNPLDLPAILGHESAGTVSKIGPAVTYVRPGDRVITCPSRFCGLCEFCLTGRPYLCPVLRGATRDKPRIRQHGTTIAQFAGLSSFAEMMLVDENSLVKVEDDIPIEVAAIVGCGVTTGLGAVFNTAQLRPAASAAVIGLGGVGLAALQGCYIAGARQIIAIDRWPSRLERALDLGASSVVNASECDPVKAVHEVSGGGVDFAFEAVGASKTAEQALSMTRRGGTAVIIGVMSGKTVTITGGFLQSDRTLHGCWMGSNRFRIDIPRWLDFYRQGRLKLDEYVTARIELSHINDGYAALERGEGTRTVVVF